MTERDEGTKDLDRAPDGAIPDKPALQELVDAVEETGRAWAESAAEARRACDYDNRWHAVRHALYLERLRLSVDAKEHNYDEAKQRLRHHYPELFTLLEAEGYPE